MIKSLRLYFSLCHLFLLPLFLAVPLLPASPFPGVYSLEQRLHPLASPERETLMNQGSVIYFHPDSVDLILMPQNSLQTRITEQVKDLEATIGIEDLTLITELPGAYKTMDPRESELILHNIFRSVRTLEGIEYFSSSSGHTKVFFVESWTIDHPRRKRPLPDLLVSTIPSRDEIYIHQKDLSFGKNESTMTFLADEGVLGSSIINLTPMRYKGIFRIISPQDMQIHLMVIPVPEGILLYGALAAKTINAGSLKSRAQKSFASRIASLRDWYIKRIFEEF